MIPVRLYQERPQSTMSGLNAPGGAGCFPTPACCPLFRLGNGARIATRPKAPLGPGRTSLIEPGFAQFSQGLPPMGLQGVRAARSRRGHADPVVRAVFFRYRCADAGHESASPCPSAAGRAEAGVVPGLGAPVIPRRRGGGPAAAVLVAGNGGGGPLLLPLHAGQGGEHGERVVDEASAGPGH